MVKERNKRNYIFIFTIFIISLVALSGCKAASDKPNQTPGSQSQQNRNSVAKPDTAAIKYEVVKQWTLPGNGVGMLLLISPTIFNEQDMTLLGTKIHDVTNAATDAYVFVYDDKEAINLRDKYIAMKTTKEEDKFYEKHIVAQYNKYGATKYNEFKVYLWGFKNTKVKSVTYL